MAQLDIAQALLRDVTSELDGIGKDLIALSGKNGGRISAHQARDMDQRLAHAIGGIAIAITQIVACQAA